MLRLRVSGVLVRLPMIAEEETEQTEDQVPMSPEYRQLMASPFFTGWASQEPLFMDWGRWKGEVPKRGKQTDE